MAIFQKNSVVFAIHLLTWSVIFLLLHTVGLPQQIEVNPVREIITGLLVVSVFYLNYLVFVPLFLTQKQVVVFMLVNAILLFAVFFISKYLVVAFPDAHPFLEQLPPPPPEGMNMPREFKKDFPRHAGFLNVVIGFLIIAVSTSIKVTQSWYNNEKQRKEIQNEKLSAELLFLKSQINPHFFFNTLNSIYYLAQTKSDQSPVAILKLSEIMRYIIYETVREKVPLRKELDYIQNYIDLQLLRLNENMKVEYQIDVPNENLMIGPMLLIPFVENAFKHGIDYAQNSTISIVATAENNRLTFSVTNPKVQQNKVNLVSSGVGLKNVKKRLELLYPNNYNLTIKATRLFSVELTINLE